MHAYVASTSESLLLTAVDKSVKINAINIYTTIKVKCASFVIIESMSTN